MRIDFKQVVGIRRENRPLSLAREKDDVRVDDVGSTTLLEHSSEHSRDGSSQIDHCRSTQQVSNRYLAVWAAPPDLCNDRGGRDQRRLLFGKNACERHHGSVPFFESDECAGIEDHPRREVQATLFRRLAFVSRRNIVSARRTSFRDGFTSR